MNEFRKLLLSLLFLLNTQNKPTHAHAQERGKVIINPALNSASAGSLHNPHKIIRDNFPTRLCLPLCECVLLRARERERENQLQFFSNKTLFYRLA